MVAPDVLEKVIFSESDVLITAVYYRGQFEYFRVERKHDKFERAVMLEKVARALAQLLIDHPDIPGKNFSWLDAVKANGDWHLS
jgi:hypothetical protein